MLFRSVLPSADNVTDLPTCVDWLIPALALGAVFVAITDTLVVVVSHPSVTLSRKLYVPRISGVTFRTEAVEFTLRLLLIGLDSIVQLYANTSPSGSVLPSADNVTDLPTCVDWLIPALALGAVFVAITDTLVVVVSHPSVTLNRKLYVPRISGVTDKTEAVEFTLRLLLIGFERTLQLYANTSPSTSVLPSADNVTDLPTCVDWLIPALAVGAVFVA